MRANKERVRQLMKDMLKLQRKCTKDDAHVLANMSRDPLLAVRGREIVETQRQITRAVQALITELNDDLTPEQLGTLTALANQFAATIQTCDEKAT